MQIYSIERGLLYIIWIVAVQSPRYNNNNSSHAFLLWIYCLEGELEVGNDKMEEHKSVTVQVDKAAGKI